MKLNWRTEYPVLVTDAQNLAPIAVIRSLGRAGYPVYACAASEGALGFQSNYSTGHATSPDYGSADFIDWVREYICRNKIRAIVPSEDFLLAVRRHFREFSSLLPYSHSEQVVYAGMSKVEQILRFTQGPFAAQTAGHIPPFLLVDDSSSQPLRKTMKSLGLPLYIKVDGSFAKGQNRGRVDRATSLEDAESRLTQAASDYKKILVEGHVPGRGVGAFFLIWQNQVRAEFMHLRLHEVPHTGGTSSYRKSWWHEGVRADALAKLKAMEWQGVAMMEYRWDETSGLFHFMEMNGRFWESLHLPLRAGIDFPLLLLDHFHGREPIARMKPAKNVRCRNTPGELGYLRSRWIDSSVRWPAKIWSLLEFVSLGLNPRVGSDLWYRGDTMLYWLAMLRFITRMCVRYLLQRGR